MKAGDSIAIRRASSKDAGALKILIEGGYRGDSARRGWTHEADIVEDERITMADLAAMLSDPAIHFLIAERDGHAVGCIAVTDRGDDPAYFGLLCVDPPMQASGLGGRLMKTGEDLARGFGAAVMEISVIENREPLIAWYERKGYCDIGRRDPFVTPQDPPLFFRVLQKPL